GCVQQRGREDVALRDGRRLASARAQSANPRKSRAGGERPNVVGGVIQLVVVDGVAPKQCIRRGKVLVHTNLSVVLTLPAGRWKGELVARQVRYRVQIEEGLYDLGYNSRTVQCGSAAAGICQSCVVGARIHQLVTGCR